MAKETMVKVRFEWVQSGVDPIQYKPFGNQYVPIGVQIELEVPAKFVIENTEENGIVISPAGMAYISHELSMAIKKSYSE